MENTQHTPKEEAQVPEAVPPLLVHSIMSILILVSNSIYKQLLLVELERHVKNGRGS